MSLDLDAATPVPAARNHRAGPEHARQPARRRSLSKLDLKYSPYLYVLPFFVIFAIFGIYPIVYTVWIALTDRSPLNPTINFVGLEPVDSVQDARSA